MSQLPTTTNKLVDFRCPQSIKANTALLSIVVRNMNTCRLGNMLILFAVLSALIMVQAVSAASMELELHALWADVLFQNGSSGSIIVTVENTGDVVLEDVELRYHNEPDWIEVSIEPELVPELSLGYADFNVTFTINQNMSVGNSSKVWFYSYAHGGTQSIEQWVTVQIVAEVEEVVEEPPEASPPNVTENQTLPGENLTQEGVNETVVVNTSEPITVNVTGVEETGAGNDSTAVSVVDDGGSGGGISFIFVLGTIAVLFIFVLLIWLLLALFRGAAKKKDALGPRIIVHGTVSRKFDEGFYLDISGTFVLIRTKEKVVDHQHILVDGHYVKRANGYEIHAVRIEPYGKGLLNNPFF